MEWKSGRSSPDERHVPGLGLIGSKWRPSKNVWRYAVGSWKPAANMRYAKYFHRTIVWDNEIVHVGGCLAIERHRGNTFPADCRVRYVSRIPAHHSNFLV